MQKNLAALFTLMLITVLGFQNCGYFSSGMDTSAFSSSLCGGNFDPIPAFKDGYHAVFTKHNCTQCHDAGGVGSGDFAQSNLRSAFAEFDMRGPDKIKNKIKSGHQSYNFSALEDDLLAAEELHYAARENVSCGKNNGELTTASKSLTFFESELNFGKKTILIKTVDEVTQPADEFLKIQTLTFDLDDDYFKPAIPGAQLVMEVEVYYDTDFFFPTHYQIRNIKLKSPTQALKVQGVTVLLNGKDYLVTTFQGVDTQVNPSDSFTELDPGAADAIFLKDETEIYDNTDAWSISLDSLKIL